ncbi:MAG: hypothetical protein WAW16_06905 [Candidatus Cryosericum sp.]
MLKVEHDIHVRQATVMLYAICLYQLTQKKPVFIAQRLRLPGWSSAIVQLHGFLPDRFFPGALLLPSKKPTALYHMETTRAPIVSHTFLAETIFYVVLLLLSFSTSLTDVDGWYCLVPAAALSCHRRVPLSHLPQN